MYEVPSVVPGARTPWYAHLLLGSGMLLIWQSTRFLWGQTLPQFPRPGVVEQTAYPGAEQFGGKLLLAWIAGLLVAWLLVHLPRSRIGWLQQLIPLSCVVVPVISSLNLAMLPQERMEVVGIMLLGTICIARAWSLRQHPSI